MRALALVALILVAACTPSPAPAPMPPDASDAAPPVPVVDAGPAPSTCMSACGVLSSLCGPTAPTCATTLAQVEHDRLIRSASGQPLTCACVAAAKSKADVGACGVSCQ